MYNHPAIKQTPPNGVIAPNLLISVIERAYRLNENNNIPITNKYPEIEKSNSLNNFDKIPFVIRANE